MKITLFKKFAKYALLRAVILGVVSIITFLFPKFLSRGMIYLAAAYMILASSLNISYYVTSKDTPKIPINYFNILLTGFMIVGGVFSIIYFPYLVSLLPVFLASLMIIESLVYFVVAICSQSKFKFFLTLISISIFIGSNVLIIFTFGFGGINGLSKIFGTLVLLSFLYELVAYLISKYAYFHVTRD